MPAVKAAGIYSLAYQRDVRYNKKEQTAAEKWANRRN
jgi:hypothetical protein